MPELLQLRVLRLCLLQDGDIGVGVLPKIEKAKAEAAYHLRIARTIGLIAIELVLRLGQFR